MTTIETDVLVIGAGPSGTIAAAILNKSNLKVTIVEKLQFPRFVIGESLLPRCMEALEEANFLDVVKGKKFQEKFGAKFVRESEVFDINFSDAHTKGYTWTWQVPRADFDLTLAEECQRRNINIHYKTEVTGIEFYKDESSLTTCIDGNGNKLHIRARFIIDGSGYGRVIPKLLKLDKPSQLPTRETLFTHYLDENRSEQHDPNRITIIVHNETTWVWCIPFSNGVTSVGFVGSPDFFSSLSGDATDKMIKLISSEPNLRSRFQECKTLFEPTTIKGWSVTTEKFFGPGFVLTGNVTEFLDPVFSSGVTLASVSAQNAAKLVIKHLKGDLVDWQKDYTDVCMLGINVFRTFVTGWYNGDLHKIFFAKNQKDEIRKQISSVLAGYVWDQSNPFVSKHQKIVPTLASFLSHKPTKSDEYSIKS